MNTDIDYDLTPDQWNVKRRLQVWAGSTTPYLESKDALSTSASRCSWPHCLDYARFINPQAAGLSGARLRPRLGDVAA